MTSWILCLGAVAQLAGPPVILDTDLGADCDDAGALAVLHALADRDEATPLAVTSCVSATWTPGCLASINQYYGRRDLPVGAIQLDGYAAGSDAKFARPVAERFPGRIQRRDQVPEAVDLLRQVLAGQADRTVRLVAVGPLTNLQRLLGSPPDRHSRLSGRDLVAAKVAHLTIMGGLFPASGRTRDQAEYNLRQDAPAAAAVAEQWPTPILYSGFEIGSACPTGATLATATPETNPVRLCYELYTGGPGKARQSWDLTAVVAAVRGAGQLWGLSPAGRCAIDPTTGANRWIADPNGRDRYLVARLPGPQVAAAIEALLVQPPRT